ncbi:PD-(D/E)XK nuclease-like domain-containing protein [Micromonospora sp. C41]|uniref:PD-(D/E)XK nuclease-like domain-containing protein n=1 Tax=Micromonospora sp. C41 TaxID=2824878 RepID=UPI001B36FF6D|nr:PD-(D/E)XK nuclease-like domain-containing protein [Micromonospora sp. C41]MBQ1064504.1 PD-(D/E)XK nuclease-like domain-containing protein [Micromonospora sp. C41]
MTTTEVIVTEPGLYPNMPEDVYHADPVPGGSLSSSGARRLLETCPARFDYERRNPPPSREEFDLGKAFHTKALGAGADIVVVDAKNWLTKDAKAARAAAYAAGKVPLLTRQAEQVDAMSAAVRQHPLAGALLGKGEVEQSLFWTDDRTGIWRRARTDLLRPDAIVDLKSCESADEEHIRKAITRYGYHAQADYYREAARALGLGDLPFLFVFVETAPPHLIHVVQVDADALAAGRHLNNRAIDLFAQCQRTGEWPGYASDITTISLPPYALRALEF